MFLCNVGTSVYHMNSTLSQTANVTELRCMTEISLAQ